jgi:hypothetical protein
MLIPADVISEKVVSLMGLCKGVHGIVPLNGSSGIPLLIHALREGGRQRNPSTTLSALHIFRTSY